MGVVGWKMFTHKMQWTALQRKAYRKYNPTRTKEIERGHQEVRDDNTLSEGGGLFGMMVMCLERQKKAEHTEGDTSEKKTNEPPEPQ